MNRRGFLATFAAVAAGVVLDPERLLWLPGAKTIFLPAPKPTLATSEALTIGDVFTIEGVYGINPRRLESTGYLQEFVITKHYVSPGDVNLNDICPRIVTDGHYRNVTAFSGRNRVMPIIQGKELPCTVTWIEA